MNMLKQKSKVQRLELENGKNNFFYGSLMMGRNKNQITQVRSEDGSALEGEEQIWEEAEHYFKKILHQVFLQVELMQPKIGNL